jgi:hypothetical protein
MPERTPYSRLLLRANVGPFAAPRGWHWTWVPEHALVCQRWPMDEYTAHVREHVYHRKVRDGNGRLWMQVLRRNPD